MVKPRVPEVPLGPASGITLETYDAMLRTVRDRGWLKTRDIVASGIRSGHALEIGPGPGYTGLEWLKLTAGTRLTGVDIAPELLGMARDHADEYGLSQRVEYLLADARELPFAADLFDGVFASYSLHEWAEPAAILREVERVLKPGGVLCLADFDRSTCAAFTWVVWLRTRPTVMRKGLFPSVRAAYTPAEARELAEAAGLTEVVVRRFWRGLVVRAKKSERIREKG